MIEIKNINIIYDSRQIIEESQIMIPRGVLTGISGESGSGKTSLFYIIGLISKFRGYEYYYNGEKINLDDDSYKSQIRKNRIGFIFQDKNLHEYLSIEDNLKMYSYISGNEYQYETALYVLKKVHLDLELSTPTRVLSGGEKQRLAIACALMKNPDLIIADEPTSALDKDNSQSVIDVLKDIAHEGKMVIIASHNKSILNQCDVQYRIENKRISLEKGTAYQNETNEHTNKVKIIEKFYKWYARFEFGKGKWEKYITLLIPSLIISFCVAGIFLKDSMVHYYSTIMNDMASNEVLVESKSDSITTQGFDLLKRIEGVESVHYIYYDYADKIRLNDSLVDLDGIVIIPYFDDQIENITMEKEYDSGNIYLSYSLAKKLSLQDSNEIEIQAHLLNEEKYQMKGYFQRDSMLSQSKGEDIIYVPYECFHTHQTSNVALVKVSHFQYLDGISEKINTINPTFTVTLSQTKYLSQISFINLYEQNMVNFLIVLLSIAIILLLVMNFFAVRNQKYEITVLKANGLSNKEILKLVLVVALRTIVLSIICISIMLILENTIIMCLGYPSFITSLGIVLFMIVFVSLVYMIPYIFMAVYLNRFDPESMLRF